MNYLIIYFISLSIAFINFNFANYFMCQQTNNGEKIFMN